MLVKTLGSHIAQAGASKSPDVLRFDFTHFSPLTPEEVQRVEDEVNNIIMSNMPIIINEMSMDDAKQAGAVALFGEKYGDTVRVVDIQGFWAELCGGTHVPATGNIGPFKILSETGISAGVRRIEAVAGHAALAYHRNNGEQLAQIATLLKSPMGNIAPKLEQLIETSKETQKQLEALKQSAASDALGDILNQGEQIDNITLYSAILEGLDMDAIRNLSDDLIGKIAPNGVLLFAAAKDGKASLLVRATKDAVAAGIHCGNIVKAAATATGGGGGGRPDMATAGIKDTNLVDKAIEVAKSHIHV